MLISIAFVSLFVFLIAAKKIKKIIQLAPRIILTSPGLGVLGFFLYHTLSFSALARIPASMNAILVSTNVVFIAIFAIILSLIIIDERFSRLFWVGGALILGGIIITNRFASVRSMKSK